MAPKPTPRTPFELFTFASGRRKQPGRQPGACQGFKGIELAGLDDKNRAVRAQVRQPAELFELALRGRVAVEMQRKPIPGPALEHGLAVWARQDDASALTAIVSSFGDDGGFRRSKSEKHSGQERPERVLAEPLGPKTMMSPGGRFRT